MFDTRPVLAADQAADPVRILALGDSLTAGYNLPRGHGFAPVLERRLRAAGYPVAVIDGGVSGDTTAGGLARLDWMLGGAAASPPDGIPDIAIVELGANDALRGVPPDTVRANLSAIIERLQAAGVRVLLAGMLAPPNMGPAYGERFNAIFPEVAEAYDVAFHAFFLEGVAADPEYLQQDGMHPTAAGVERIVEGILPLVETLVLREVTERNESG